MRFQLTFNPYWFRQFLNFNRNWVPNFYTMIFDTLLEIDKLLRLGDSCFACTDFTDLHKNITKGFKNDIMHKSMHKFGNFEFVLVGEF